MTTNNKWEKFWKHKDWTPGKEAEESKEHLLNFFDAIVDETKSGALFRLGLFSLKKVVLPNGYTFEFVIKQGTKPEERHEWCEPKETNSLSGRRIRRCKHCRRAFANRIANARCDSREPRG